MPSPPIRIQKTDQPHPSGEDMDEDDAQAASFTCVSFKEALIIILLNLTDTMRSESGRMGKFDEPHGGRGLKC